MPQATEQIGPLSFHFASTEKHYQKADQIPACVYTDTIADVFPQVVYVTKQNRYVAAKPGISFSTD